MLLSIFGLGPSEILIVLLFVIVLIVGPKKIPELFRALGQSVGELKKGIHESEEEMKKEETKKSKKSKKKR